MLAGLTRVLRVPEVHVGHAAQLRRVRQAQADLAEALELVEEPIFDPFEERTCCSASVMLPGVDPFGFASALDPKPALLWSSSPGHFL